jgi:hypothetical protein
MRTISQSAYIPGNLFQAKNPAFTPQVGARLYFMSGLAELMDEGERLCAVHRELADFIVSEDYKITPVDILKRRSK